MKKGTASDRMTKPDTHSTPSKGPVFDRRGPVERHPQPMAPEEKEAWKGHEIPPEIRESYGK